MLRKIMMAAVAAAAIAVVAAPTEASARWHGGGGWHGGGWHHGWGGGFRRLWLLPLRVWSVWSLRRLLSPGPRLDAVGPALAPHVRVLISRAIEC